MAKTERDFAKPWHRDAHLPKLDVRLLPILKTRQWTTVELVEYCHEEMRGGTYLDPNLIARWLSSASERGLVLGSKAVEAPAMAWGITDRGYSRGRFAIRMLDRLGGVAGLAGIVAFLIGLASDRLGANLQPVAAVAFSFSALVLIGFTVGESLAERSVTLLRKVARREALVQAAQPAKSGQPGPKA